MAHHIHVNPDGSPAKHTIECDQCETECCDFLHPTFEAAALCAWTKQTFHTAGETVTYWFCSYTCRETFIRNQNEGIIYE